MREQHRIVTDFLRSAGAELVRMERGGKHPRVVYVWKGKEQFYVLPGTPGDSVHGAKNSIGDLRCILGLTRAEKTVGERRQRKTKPRKKRAVLRVEPIVFGEPKNVLLAHPIVTDLLPEMADHAWLLFWKGVVESRGGTSLLTSFGRYRP